MHKEEIECVNHENVRVRMEGDRISSLPDEIIHRIMSFNDTKFAVQTSVLSSRWKLIWTTLPYLKLCSDAFRIQPNFFKFVDRVLSLRNNHTQVSTLELYSHQIEDWRILERIANYSVSRNVQKVNFDCCENIDCIDGYQLPLCFFNSQSLNHLCVNTHLPRQCIPPLPQSPWETPALTTVELHFIDFDAICLDLFSKCVNLMNLTLSYCFQNKEGMVMKIHCPRLLHLSISNCGISAYEILAPNLSSLSYEGWSWQFLSRGGLNSLEKVNLCWDIADCNLDNEEMQTKAHEFMNMLHDLSSARFVTLHAPVIEFLSEVLDFVEHQPSPLCNLKCLSIRGVKTERKRLKSYITNQVVNYLLNSSPTATVSMEYPEGKLHDAVGELPKDADGGMSCVGENVPSKSMESGKSSMSDIFAAVQADFEAKMESLKASMEVEFSRRLEAQQVEFSRRLEAQQVEFSRRLEAQQVEFSRRFESQQVKFSRHLN